MNGDFFLDHVVICVSDLEPAAETFRGFGFTVTDGGVHANGASRNALMVFADGSYLELLQFLEPARTGGVLSTLGRRLLARGDGLADVALGASSLTDTLARARASGVGLDGPIGGRRRRPDGAEIEFQVAVPATLDLPFFCVDVTPRSLRVPTENTDHANGARGIARVSIVVRDLAATTKRCEALLGLAMRETDTGEREIVTGGTRVSFGPCPASSALGEDGRCTSIEVRGGPSKLDWTELHPLGGGLVRLVRDA